MEEEDEIDVLGEFDLDSLLSKNEDQISYGYDGDHQLGLHCESQWVMDTTSQSCWDDTKSDQTSGEPAASQTHDWTAKEKYLLEKGLELFGRSWSRLAQYIGTKNAKQVKSYVKASLGWSGKSCVSSSSIVVDNADLNFSELIDDMDIPASVEEVIASVSTAQPTVVLPSAHRDPSSHRNYKRKKRRIGSKKKVLNGKIQETKIYNLVDIKDVLGENKEQDCITLPTGEQVMRIRHEPSVSGESDVEIDVDSDHVSDTFPAEENKTIKEPNVNSTKSFAGDQESLGHQEDVIIENAQFIDGDIFIDDIGHGVSVITESVTENNEQCEKKEKQIFKADILTPSGKILTVVVDEAPCTSVDVGMPTESLEDTFKQATECPEGPTSEFSPVIRERLEKVQQLPAPYQENLIDRYTATQEEKNFHPEFFITKSSRGLQKYLKIRNYIVDCWKKSKPTYLTPKSMSDYFTNFEDPILIKRIHTYLEMRGYINFGCEQCHYKRTLSTAQNPHNSKTTNNPFSVDANVNKPTLSLLKRSEVNDKNGIIKAGRRKFIPKENLGVETGGYTITHNDSGEVAVEFKRPYEVGAMVKTKTSKRIRPAKLIHCKNHSSKNKAPYLVELEVSALVLVDVHSHLSPCSEVIGLLGGHYSPGLLTISMALPCRTVLSTNVHCDMCPVSQLESSEAIANQNLSVVGWYHSHPNFDPSPSDMDVDTQSMLQTWFSETGTPFVGLIIAPYYSSNVSIFRCCHVMKEKNGLNPYKLDVKVTNNNEDQILVQKSIETAFNTVHSKDPIKQSVIHKCLESVLHQLRKAMVDEQKITQVTYEIQNFFRSVSRKP